MLQHISQGQQGVWGFCDAVQNQTSSDIVFPCLIDPNFKDQTNQQGDNSQLPVNIMQPQMNVMTPVNTQHQPMNIFPYPMGVHAPIMNIQHNPFNLPPPVPMHLHTGVPLVQVATPTNMSQGPPPPPPPPPPSQQVNYVASQLDGKQLQVRVSV